MTIGKAIRWTAVVALLGAVTVSAQQEVRITQEVMTTNPLGGPGPGGGLNPIPQGTGLILGQIVEAGSSQPIPGALVTSESAGLAADSRVGRCPGALRLPRSAQGQLRPDRDQARPRGRGLRAPPAVRADPVSRSRRRRARVRRVDRGVAVCGYRRIRSGRAGRAGREHGGACAPPADRRRPVALRAWRAGPDRRPWRACASGRSSRANTRSPSRWRAARACRLT